jgi:hypothetical protein
MKKMPANMGGKSPKPVRLRQAKPDKPNCRMAGLHFFEATPWQPSSQ